MTVRRACWSALLLILATIGAAPFVGATHNPTNTHVHDPTWTVCAHPDGDTGCGQLAVSGTGEAFCWFVGCAAASAQGDTSCFGPACTAASGEGDTSGSVAVSATGETEGELVAVSLTQDAEGGLVAVSGTGHASNAEYAVSACDAASDAGVDVLCTDLPEALEDLEELSP
jgi:hypothetical protein